MPRKPVQSSSTAARRRSPPPREVVDTQLTNNPLTELEISLGERAKELKCLYHISHLRETHPHSPERFLQGVVDSLPRSWRYPPFACARIKLDDTGEKGEGIYTSARFHEGPWQMSAEVRGEGKRMGEVQVWYRKGVPMPLGKRGGDGEGPFLKEETALLHAVAERIATSLLHMKAEADLRETHRQLHRQHQELQETNIALRTVLSRLEEDKQQVRTAMIANVQKIIMPIVYELELAATGRQRTYVTLLRRSLQEITSPFLSELSTQHLELTPVEIAICAMIRNGLATKEIAQIRGIALGTVRRHRENIRRKLGLHNRAANLVTYLQAAPHEQRSHRQEGGGGEGV